MMTTSVYSIMYNETRLLHAITKPQSCIKQTIKKIPDVRNICNLTCINRTYVYSEHISWSKDEDQGLA
jgi:S-adenosylmethionine:tRNA-ribosyltransferase-isomerase (queuine synthetase)